MKLNAFKLLLLVLTLSSSVSNAQVTPTEMVKRMGKGINLGNILEAPYEGDWAPPAEAYNFHDIIDAGFTSVRIPVRWTNHMLDVAPYTVDSAWMDRVEQVIDWALDTGLVVIINSHHDNDWLYDGFPKNIDKFEMLWEQIATRFKNKSENLVFEIINEPYFDLSKHDVDTLHQVAFPIIRKSNPTRIVLFTGGGNDETPRLTNYRVFYHLNIPDDPYVMAYFHYYVPYQYAQLGNGTWGTNQEKQQMISDFTVARDWSDTHGVPILLGEFAVIRTAHRPSLVAWYELLSSTADEFGFAQTTWCNGNRDGMSTYFRTHKYWDQELVNIQTRQFPYAGNPANMPVMIEAEDFDKGGQQRAYFSADSINSLGYYRPNEGIEIDTVNNAGYAVFIEHKGEWMEYTFKVDTASLYEIVLHASSLEEGNTIMAEFNGVNTTESFLVPVAGSMNEFADLKDTIYLETGVQVVRVVGESKGVYIDKLLLNKLAIPEDTSNLLVNPDFELGIVAWTANSCAIEIVDEPVQSGSAAMLVSERNAHWASLQQDITDILLEKGPGYYTSAAHMRSTVDSSISGKVTIRLTVAGENSYIGGGDSIPPGKWAYMSNNIEISWEGNLQNALFYIETLSPYAGDFICDNTMLRLDSLKVITPPPVGIGDLSSTPGFNLDQNHPNPFKYLTSIGYSIASPGRYQLLVYDLNGRVVLTAMDTDLETGRYSVNMDAGILSPGTYFYRLSGPGVNLTRKMILMK